MALPQSGNLSFVTVFYDLLKAVITIGGSSAASVFFVNRAKSKADFIERRIDDLCSDIRTVADLATDYWMAPAGQNNLASLEAKIQTRIAYIERMRVTISQNAKELISEPIITAGTKLMRTVTGGDFGVHNRPCSPEQAQQSQYSATRYITVIRKARADTYNN